MAGLRHPEPEEVGLVTDLFSALLDCLLWDVSEEEGEGNETWLWLLKTYTEGKIPLFWPEILRIVI